MVIYGPLTPSQIIHLFLISIGGCSEALLTVQFMKDEGLLPSLWEEIKIRNAIEKLKQIVMDWAKRVAFPQRYIQIASATILIYGSFALGAHTNESGIDALCVGPCFATLREDFFVVLRDMLACRLRVSEILCIKDASSPRMRLNIDGIFIELSYAKLETAFAPENVLDPFFSVKSDEISWRSLSAVHVNENILHLVPKLEVYQSLLRCVKLWARRRGIYASGVGFLGGVHLAALAAYVCRRRPDTDLSNLVSVFFQTFASWLWPTPVFLEDGVMRPPPNNILTKMYIMPIQLPCSLRLSMPNEYCYCGVTRSTYERIIKELQRGHALMKDFLLSEFDWKVLFQPFSYAKTYENFLKICLSASQQNELEEWVVRVKSQLHHLLFMLEELLEFCDPNPTEYINHHLLEPHVLFYWGLCLGESININVDSIKEDFKKKKIFEGYEGPVGTMELTVVKASEFPETRTNCRSK